MNRIKLPDRLSALKEIHFRKPAKPPGLRSYALRTTVINAVCMVVAVLVCHALLSKGLTVAALCAIVIAAGIIFYSNLMFALDMRDPIVALTEFVRRISEGGYGLQATKTCEDEIGELTDAINQVSARICEYEKVQSEFISSVSHELRTPLTAITGWSETMLFDSRITGDSRRGLEIIGREAGRLTNMVNDLLEFTRIQDGRFKLTMETVDIIAEVEDAVLAYSDLLGKENMQVNFHFPEDEIPLVNGDPERLRQVFLNILDNAAKYAGSGRLIDIGVKHSDDLVAIMFRDYGPGIPEGEISRVKEKFYKGSSHVRGNGIGLAVCDEIITRHGGELLISNAEGGGIIVTVLLPVRETLS